MTSAARHPRAPVYLAATVAALVVLLSASAAAGPAPTSDQKPVAEAEVDQRPIRVKSPSTLRTDGGSEVRLPAGVLILWPETWETLDTEVSRLQAAETRLTAENRVLRKAVSDGGSGWGTVVVVVGVLLAGIGAAAHAL